MTHIFVNAPFPEYLIEKIKGVSREIVVEPFRLTDENWPDGFMTEAEIIYTNSVVPHAESSPNLRWVQSHWAGIRDLRERPIWQLDTIITSASGVNASNVAQYVFSKILFFAFQLGPQQTAQSGHATDGFAPIDLRGKTLGIVGYGSVGREIARVAKTFGMDVLASKRNLRKTSENGYRLEGTGDPEGVLPLRLYPGEATRSMIAECDFVVISVPLTEKTDGLFSDNMFKAMKPTSYIINVSRGRVVNEGALVQALSKGWIAGAALDGFSNEILSPSSQLYKLPNVVITPNLAGQTASYNERVVDLFCENVRRYLVGEPLLNVINRENGY